MRKEQTRKEKCKKREIKTEEKQISEQKERKKKRENQRKQSKKRQERGAKKNEQKENEWWGGAKHMNESVERNENNRKNGEEDGLQLEGKVRNRIDTKRREKKE